MLQSRDRRQNGTDSLPWIPLRTSAPFFMASSVSLFMLADSIALTWRIAGSVLSSKPSRKKGNRPES